MKSSEDNFNEGVKFHLYGTSLSGAKVDEYATTDKNGIANFKNILVSGDNPYILEEVDTSIRYVVPKSQTAPVVWDKATKREFINVLKKFTVTVEKTDAEAKKAQGDATLAGAKYGIYDGDKLVDTYTTDKDGKFTTKEYVCGDNWTIREIEPSEGYLLNETVYNVGAEAKNYTVEHNPISVGVTEQIIKGEIEIIKHTEQGVLTKQRTVSVIPLSATKRDTQNQRSCLMALTPSIRPTAGKADTMLTTSMYSSATTLSRTASSLIMISSSPILRLLRWMQNQEEPSPMRERDSRFMHPIIL